MRLQRSRTALAAICLTVAGGALAVGTDAAGAADGDGQRAAGRTGTLVFVKAHNLWISRPDGTGQRRITTDGTPSRPYFSPSMADDGTVAAGHDGQIVRMRQGGTVLNRFTPRPLRTSSGGSAASFGQVAISPGGAKIAYSAVDTACTSCSTATGYTAATRPTDPRADRSTYFRMPSWVGNGRTLQSGGFLSEVMVHDLGSEPVHWFDSDDGLTDVELSPDGRRLAGAAGYQGGDGISSYDVVGNATSGPVPQAPVLRCTWSDDDGAALVGPTWGPDSKALAFVAADGVWIGDDVTVGCTDVSFRLVVPGATEPDWSPAAYQPEPRVTARTFSITGRSKAVGRLRVGRTVAVRLGKVSPRPTTTSYQWKVDGRSVGKGTKRTYRVKRSDRRKKLSVTVTLRRAGYVTEQLAVPAGRVR